MGNEAEIDTIASIAVNAIAVGIDHRPALAEIEPRHRAEMGDDTLCGLGLQHAAGPAPARCGGVFDIAPRHVVCRDRMHCIATSEFHAAAGSEAGRQVAIERSEFLVAQVEAVKGGFTAVMENEAVVDLVVDAAAHSIVVVIAHVGKFAQAKARVRRQEGLHFIAGGGRGIIAAPDALRRSLVHHLAADNISGRDLVAGSSTANEVKLASRQ